jgi:hypothetical protein
MVLRKSSAFSLKQFAGFGTLGLQLLNATVATIIINTVIFFITYLFYVIQLAIIVIESHFWSFL